MGETAHLQAVQPVLADGFDGVDDGKGAVEVKRLAPADVGEGHAGRHVAQAVEGDGHPPVLGKEAADV